MTPVRITHKFVRYINLYGFSPVQSPTVLHVTNLLSRFLPSPYVWFLPCACAQSVTVQNFRYSCLAHAHSLSRYSISVILALRMRTVCNGTAFPLFLACASAQSVTVQHFRYYCLAHAHSLSRYNISVILALRMRTVCHGTEFPLFSKVSQWNRKRSADFCGQSVFVSYYAQITSTKLS